MDKYGKILFNAIFLVLFCTGCLIGIMLFLCASDDDMEWICVYGMKLFSQMPECLMGVAISACRPFLALLIISLFPWGHRLVPVLILIRGALNSYFVCVCYVSGISIGGILLHGVFILPGYYLVCRWICFGKPMCYAAFNKSVV